MVNDTFDTQTFAVYGSMSFDITEPNGISFALRYDEDREVTNNVPSPADGVLTNIDLTILAVAVYTQRTRLWAAHLGTRPLSTCRLYR